MTEKASLDNQSKWEITNAENEISKSDSIIYRLQWDRYVKKLKQPIIENS